MSKDCFRHVLVPRLNQHPQIVIKGKEKHWFDVNRFRKNMAEVRTYIDLFNKAVPTLKQSPNSVTGDLTPSYMFESIYWKCYEVNTPVE